MPARATLNSSITDTGGENCTVRGFEWGEESGNYPHSWTENGDFGIGDFSHTVENLPLEKTIYCRAKALNSAGWGYSGEQSFVTPSAEITRFNVPMIRAIMSPVPLGKITREGIVVRLRKGRLKFEAQLPVKKVE